VLPAVAVSVAVVQAVDGATASAVLGRTVGTTITVGVHLAFWTTLAFATIERTSTVPARDLDPGRPAAVARAPLPPRRAARRCHDPGPVHHVVLLSPTVSTERDAAGEPIGILSPWLLDSGLVYVFVAFAVGGLGFAVAERHFDGTFRSRSPEPWSTRCARQS